MTDRWRDRALCRADSLLAIPTFAGAVVHIVFDPDWWFPERQGEPAFLAKRICAACPVRRECLDDAVDSGEEFGIWGGAGDSVRRALRNLEPDRRATATDRHFVRLDYLAATGRQARGTQASFGPGATHGKKSTYVRGCRGDDCRVAMGLEPRGHACPYVPGEVA